MTKPTVVSALRDQLGNGVDVHRCAAARALGKIADPMTTDVLCEALLDEDPDVRTDAAAALGKLADPQTADKLLDNLIGDPCCEVKISAIEAMVNMCYAPIVPWLRRLVSGRDEDIAWDDEEFHAGGWDDWLDVQLAAIRGLGELGATDGIPEILAAFDDEMGQDVSEHAIFALRRLGAPGVQALIRLYEDGDLQLRRRVASVIGETSQHDLEALRDRCLNDNDVEVRRAAAIGLAQIDPTDQRLVEIFSDRDADLRKQVVELCGASFPDETRSRLEDPVPAVRCAAFRVVADRPELFDRDGFDELIRSNVRGHPLVAGEAANAWAALTGEEALAALNTSFSDTEQPVPFRRLLIKALKRLGGNAVDVLAKAAGDDDRQIRIDTLTALAGIATKEKPWPGPAGRVLLTALNGELVAPPSEDSEADKEEPNDSGEATSQENSEEGVESRKASTLDVILTGGDDAGSGPDTEAASEIELTDEDLRRMELAKRRAISKKKVSLDVKIAPYQDVRRFAAQLLGDVAEEVVAEHLIAMLADADVELQQAALDSLTVIGEQLGKLPKEAAEPLLAIIGEGVHELRMPAVRALTWVSSADASDRLHDLLSDEDVHVRLEAVRGTERRREIGDDVQDLLNDDYPGIRLAAAGAMARVHGAEAVDSLVAFAFANDGMYRHEVGKLLRDVAPHDAAERFLEVLADDSRRREWLVAIDALGDIGPFTDTPDKLVAA